MPRKRAAPKLPSRSSKRVKISDATDVIGAQRSEESHPSGRPKRSGPEPIYNFTRPKYPNAKLIKRSASSHGQSRGGDSASEPVKRGRGKPETSEPPIKEPAKRGRGRPKVSESNEQPISSVPKASPLKKRLGRPPKSPSNRFTRIKSHTASKPPTARQAAFSPKIKSSEPLKSTMKLTGKRGRPKKSHGSENADSDEVEPENNVEVNTAKPAKQGRKLKTHAKANKSKTAATKDELSADVDDVDSVDPVGAEEEVDDDRQYWLMKAEPETRYENGVDVSFSIDDLMRATEPEGWDGVRNLAARNNMRAMKLGDLAFFYHSNCKVPGIAGVMSIAREHSTDKTAFNSKSPYHDPKCTRDNPKWDLVHVQFEKKFKEIISLNELKGYAKPGGALEGLQTLRQTRLSVSKVTPKEWKFIMSLAEDEDEAGADNGEDEDQGEFSVDEEEESGLEYLTTDPTSEDLVQGNGDLKGTEAASEDEGVTGAGEDNDEPRQGFSLVEPLSSSFG